MTYYVEMSAGGKFWTPLAVCETRADAEHFQAKYLARNTGYRVRIRTA